MINHYDMVVLMGIFKKNSNQIGKLTPHPFVSNWKKCDQASLKYKCEVLQQDKAQVAQVYFEIWAIKIDIK